MRPIAEVLGAVTELFLLLCPVLVGVTPINSYIQSTIISCTQVGVMPKICHIKRISKLGDNMIDLMEKIKCYLLKLGCCVLHPRPEITPSEKSI